MLLGLNSIAIIGCLVIASLVVLGHKTVAETPRVHIETPGFRPAPEVARSGPVNFLVVGTDSSDGLAENDPLRTDRDAGRRSDVMMIVRVNPSERTAELLSLPRDLWVEIPGHGSNKINAAMVFGEDAGPSLLIDTIKRNFDIDINHYVEINFASFKKVVDVINGVNIYISQPLRDGHSGLFQPNTGCQNLDAGQALAYARSRHLFWQDSAGKWHNDPTGDLGRVRRQQDFVRQVLSQAINQGARNPATLARLIDGVQGSVILDTYTTAQDLIDLSGAFKSFEPEELEAADLPVIDVRRGSAATLDLVQPEAELVLSKFRGTGSSGVANSIDVSQVTVRVENSGAVEGSAISATDTFDEIGFRVLSPRDGEEPVDATAIHFPRGALNQAKLVARYLDSEPALVQDDKTEEIKVVLGTDFTAVLTTPRAAEDITDVTVMATTTTLASATSQVETGAVTTTTAKGVDRNGDPPVGESYLPVSAGHDC